MGEQVAAGSLWGCSSVGRAPALQAGGREFESLHLQAESGRRKIPPVVFAKERGLIAQPVRAHA